MIEVLAIGLICLVLIVAALAVTRGRPFLVGLVLFGANRFIYELVLVSGLQIGGGVASQTALRVSALATALGVGLLALRGVVRVGPGFLRTLAWPALLFLFLWNGVAFLVGLGMGNPLVYVLGDTFNIGQIGLVGAGFVALRKEHPASRVLVELWIAYLVVATVVEARYAIEYGIMALSGTIRRIQGGNILLVIFSATLLLFPAGRRRRPETVLAWSGLLFGGSSLLLAGYRGKWVLAVLGIYVAAGILVGAGILSWRRFVAAVLTPVVLGGLLLLGSGTIRDYMHRRVVEDTFVFYSGGELDMSTYQKLYEVVEVWNRVRGDRSQSLVGFGQGAEIPVTANAGTWIRQKWGWRGEVHYVHNTFAAVLLRMGWVGLASMVAFLIWITRQAWGVRPIPEEADSGSIVSPAARATALAFLVLAPVGLTQDYFVGVFFGLVEWGLLIATATPVDRAVRGHRSSRHPMRMDLNLPPPVDRALGYDISGPEAPSVSTAR